MAYCSRSLQFLQGMLGHACCHQKEMHCQNRLQLQEHPCPSIHWSLELLKVYNTKGREVFFSPNDIERCVKGSRRKWVDKISTDQEQPPIPLVWPVKIGTNLTRPEIPKFDNVGFQLSKKQRISPTASSTYRLLPLTSLEWTFLQTQTYIFLPSSQRLQDGLPPHQQQSKCRW